MEIIIGTGGNGRCVYGDSIPLRLIGRTNIRRASHVEPTKTGEWTADLSPVDGPLLGPFETRALALAAEAEWLREHWLMPELALPTE